MRKIVLSLTTASILASAAMVPTAADARRYHNRRVYHQDCRRSSGTTGALAGGAGGAVLGNVLGGGVLGTVAGGVGGALLGRHLDKKHDAAQNRRNGC
jgi:outer membrane lipoprotein SlyB